MRTKSTLFSFFICIGIAITASPCRADTGWLTNMLKNVNTDSLKPITSAKLSDTKIGQGLKEALKVGIDNAVKATGKTDGFFKNDAIKILLPENLQGMEKALRAVGFGKQIDDFVLSMNRAAEKAAPSAKDIFLNSLFDMSIDDSQKVYTGGNTAATEYFKGKTKDKLTAAFQPVVKKSLDEFAVTKKYNDLMALTQKIPFAQKVPLQDADQYVVDKAMNGLFLMLGKEETKIGQDPAARVTDLLKEVFKK